MKVLVTGSTGFVGCHVLEKLVRCGIRPVLILRTESSTDRIDHLLSECEIYKTGDDYFTALKNISNVDAVIHMAAAYKKQDFFEEVAESIEGNFSRSVELFEWSLINNVSRFIFFSTYFSRAEIDERGYCIESNKSLNIYSALKSSVEHYLEQRAGNIEVNILRLFTPYGPYDNEKLILKMIRRLVEKEDFPIDYPEQILDLIYVEDVAAVVLSLLEKQSQKQEVQLIEVGTGVGTTIADLKKLIVHKLEDRGADLCASARLADRGSSQDISGPVASGRTLEEFTSLDSGMEKTIDWVLREIFKN